MPCWELFEEQPADYRDEVLPPDVKARLSVEAGVALGWKQWVGDDGDSISIEHFGASTGPGAVRLTTSTTSSRAATAGSYEAGDAIRVPARFCMEGSCGCSRGCTTGRVAATAAPSPLTGS